jgi:hypothetical protein
MPRLVALLCIGVLAVNASFAADDKEKEKVSYLDAKSAGPDFVVQGEYEGTIGKEAKVGAQVIALGGGKFDVVIYDGGLPGAGWKGKTKVRLKGETAGQTTQLSGRNFKGEIKEGKLYGVAEDNVAYEMKKVERKSPTLGAKPPEGAKVLFDGTSLDAWAEGELDGDLLAPKKRVGDFTKQKFTSFTLHVEFRTPFMPFARGQGRGNSGVYLNDQYECQVLDSFGLEGADNECGGVYKQSKPAVNMCLPPLSWQTYDIDFEAAKFDAEGKKTSNAVVTVTLNGVVVHEKLSLTAATPGGHQTDEKPGPLFLQDHGDPVRFRNIWLVEKK